MKRHGAPRRDFIKTAAVAGTGLLIVKPETVFGSRANSALQLGIIGCGGRGNTVGAEFVRSTDTHVVALADLFDDRLAATRERFDKLADEKGHTRLSDAQVFKGPRAYEQLVRAGVDAVLISSPPYFHPDHFEAAVAAGRHVYLEKPVATDVHGCKRIMKAGQQADGKVNVHVGFQTRYAPPVRDLAARIHNGGIGEIVCVQAFYYSGDLARRAKPGMSRAEARIREWVFDKVLSGDIFVEQNIHIIDTCGWMLQAHPVMATATGGRKARTDVGDVYDHYNVTLSYPNDVHLTFGSTQFTKGWSDQGARFFGTTGVAEYHHRGGARIHGDTPWDSGVDNTLEQANAEKVKAFVDGIRSGTFVNESKQGAESTLSTILGRTAAYKDAEVTWDKLVKSDEKWDGRIDLSSLERRVTRR
jgi:myo-inositol 2-dehydrogenase/D-chiro-inositol 1-dehydrogenase